MDLLILLRYYCLRRKHMLTDSKNVSLHLEYDLSWVNSLDPFQLFISNTLLSSADVFNNIWNAIEIYLLCCYTNDLSSMTNGSNLGPIS